MISSLLVFAQATTQSAEGSSSSQQDPFGGSFMFLMLAMFGIIYFVMIRPQSRERKKRDQMLSLMKKNDKVVTIGGIIGIVTAVRDDEITLKVDESSNTKITFSKAAIQRVLTPGSGGNGDGDSAKDKKA